MYVLEGILHHVVDILENSRTVCLSTLFDLLVSDVLWIWVPVPVAVNALKERGSIIILMMSVHFFYSIFLWVSTVRIIEAHNYFLPSGASCSASHLEVFPCLYRFLNFFGSCCLYLKACSSWTRSSWCHWLQSSFSKQQGNIKLMKNMAYFNSGIFLIPFFWIEFLLQSQNLELFFSFLWQDEPKFWMGEVTLNIYACEYIYVQVYIVIYLLSLFK